MKSSEGCCGEMRLRLYAIAPKPKINGEAMNRVKRVEIQGRGQATRNDGRRLALRRKQIAENDCRVIFR